MLLEVRRSSREGPEAGGGLEHSVNVDAEVWWFAEAAGDGAGTGGNGGARVGLEQASGAPAELEGGS